MISGAGAAAFAARSFTSFATPTMSILPVPSTGTLSSTTTSAGTIRSDAPFDLANAWNSERVASFLLRDQHQPLALARIGRGRDRRRIASGQSCAASISTAASEIISPPILAKRLARPLMVTKPCASIVTMSPVSCQPSGRRLEHAGIVGLEIAEHHVRPAHVEPPALVDAGHRLEPRRRARHQPADRAELVEHRRVEREHRRGLGHAIAFQDAQAELLHVGAARRFPHRLGAGQDVAQRAEVVRMRRARIAGEERVGAEHDGGVHAVDQLRHRAVVQGRRIEIDRHARDQRQDRAGRQAERVEHRQHVEQLVAAGRSRCARRPARRSPACCGGRGRRPSACLPSPR